MGQGGTVAWPRQSRLLAAVHLGHRGFGGCSGGPGEAVQGGPRSCPTWGQSVRGQNVLSWARIPPAPRPCLGSTQRWGERLTLSEHPDICHQSSDRRMYLLSTYTLGPRLPFEASQSHKQTWHRKENRGGKRAARGARPSLGRPVCLASWETGALGGRALGRVGVRRHGPPWRPHQPGWGGEALCARTARPRPHAAGSALPEASWRPLCMWAAEGSRVHLPRGLEAGSWWWERVLCPVPLPASNRSRAGSGTD